MVFIATNSGNKDNKVAGRLRRAILAWIVYFYTMEAIV